jgi:hypothetical protein
MREYTRPPVQKAVEVVADTQEILSWRSSECRCRGQCLCVRAAAWRIQGTHGVERRVGAVYRIDVILLTMAVDFTIRGKLGQTWYSGDSRCATPALVLALPTNTTPCSGRNNRMLCHYSSSRRPNRASRSSCSATKASSAATNAGSSGASGPRDGSGFPRIANSLLHVQPRKYNVHPVESLDRQPHINGDRNDRNF